MKIKQKPLDYRERKQPAVDYGGSYKIESDLNPTWEFLQKEKWLYCLREVNNLQLHTDRKSIYGTEIFQIGP